MSAAPIEPDPYFAARRAANEPARAQPHDTDREATPIRRRRWISLRGLRRLQEAGVFRSSTFIAVEVVASLLALILCGVAMAWWVLSQGPVEVPAIREAVAAELSEAREGRRVDIDRVELAWTAGRGLELRAADVILKDRRNRPLSASKVVSIGISPWHLLIGQVRLTRADFIGGEMAILRRRDGAVEIAFGPPGSEADVVFPAPPPDETLVQRVNRVLDGLEGALRPVGPGGRLKSLSVSDVRLVVLDESGDRRWSAEAAAFELARERTRLRLGARARLEGPRGPAPASLALTTDTAFRGAQIRFTAAGARPRALLSPAALGMFAGLDAPMNATLDIGLDRRAGVTRFEGDVVLGRGGAQMPGGGRFNIDGGRVRGRYDLARDVLLIDQIALAGARNRIGGRIEVANASALVRDDNLSPAVFTASLPAVRLDVPGMFPEAVSLRDVVVNGRVDRQASAVEFSRIHAGVGAAQFDAAGRLYWAPASDGAKHAGAFFQGRVTGPLDARDIVRLWPLPLLDSARSYLGDAVQGGVVTDLAMHIDIKPDDTAAGVLRDEAMRITWNFADTRFRFINSMSPITNARGSAVLQGNRLDAQIDDARLEGLAVSQVRVEIPRFNPKGAMATISGRAQGDARGVVTLLLQRPLNLRDRLPVQADTVVGRGAVSITLQRPMLSDVPYEDLRFNVSGQFEAVGGLEKDRRLTFADGRLSVRGDHRAVTVAGPIRAGASNVNVEWVENLTRGARAPSRYQISGDFDAADLERLGYPVGQVAEGRVGVTVRGAGRGYNVDSAQVLLDLRRAAVNLPWRIWTKPPNQQANARFDVARAADGGLVMSNVDLRGPGLAAVQGEVRFARDDAFMSALFPRVLIADRADARLRIDRSGDGALSVDITGAFLDATPWMNDDGGAAERRAAAGRARPPPVRAQARVERLGLRGGAALAGARVNLTVVNDALFALSAEGADPAGGAMTLSLGPRPGDAQSRITVRAPDAGFAVRALTGANNVRGGAGTADGLWTPGPPSRAQFTVRIRNFSAVRVPAMTRLLSSVASLRGLVGMLNNDGIAFDLLEAPATMSGGVVTIGESRAVGPTLGLTAMGSYDMRRDVLDIDGVVAPSYGLNSMLGRMPVLGDLFVSRQGEGMFGITYSMNGPFANARVTANPLSALAPGIFRRIFEPVQRNGGQPRQSATPPAPAPSPPAPN